MESITEVIQRGRLKWFGHLERMEDNNWVSKCRTMQVDGQRSRGRPRKTWDEMITNDLVVKGLRRDLTKDHKGWKTAIK